MRETQHTPSRDLGRLSKEQKQRLAELDYVTRTQRPRSSIVRPLVLKPGPRSFNDPFCCNTPAGPRSGDPLDGCL